MKSEMDLELHNVRLADDHMTVRPLLKRTGETMTESQQIRLDGTLWNARDSAARPRRCGTNA